MFPVAGGRGLPVAEVCQLKETIFQLFPDYWNNPIEFESLWMKCIDIKTQNAFLYTALLSALLCYCKIKIYK